MQITEGLEMIDLALYIKDYNAIVIADVHIGFEEALNKQGLLVPRMQFRDQIKRLESIIGKKRFQTIVINGDLKHEFGTISGQEWRETLAFLDFLAKHSERIVLIKGNHDTIIGPIAGKRNIEVADYLVLGDILICHGHKIVKKAVPGIKTIVIGHQHPAVSIRDGPRSELFKCFLKGKWKGMVLIAMPSFCLVSEGSDILKEELISPYLTRIDSFNVFVAGNKVYDFGRLGNLIQTRKIPPI